MGELLSGEKNALLMNEQLEELFSASFNYENPCILYPVRHHSPSCSFHLKQVIASYKPDIILIEGPENADSLMEHMASKETKAPFCIYLSFDDTKGKVSGEPQKYCAYYPFLDYSPELVAIREAKRLEIKAKFIDLSYGDLLLNDRVEKNAQKPYEDERMFTLGEYYKRLTEKTGCRNFQELWEMLFEIEGCHSETRLFVKNLFTYCYYSRISLEQEKNREEMERDEIREEVMKRYLLKAMSEHKHVLVVTGGMHSIALARSIIELEKKKDNSKKKHRIARLNPEETPVYLMPYSYEESDQVGGYQAGMPFPFYYQKVWENLQRRKKNPYEETALSFLIHTAQEMRKKQAVSITDEMQSFYMAKGLANMREKRECGVFELLDSVIASFIKGEIHAYHEPALHCLYVLLAGIKMGQVDKNAGVPPIIQDFLELCKKFRIKTDTSLKKETRLDSYNNREHREKSHFFFQMQFLNTSFCTLLKTQESGRRTGRILKRERWEWRYTPQVQTALIKVSVYGGTIREACLNFLKAKLKEGHHTAASIAAQLESAERMGLWESYHSLMDLLISVIGEDMDFISVTDCFICLDGIQLKLEQLEEEKKENIFSSLENIVHLSLNRIFTLFYTIVQVNREQEDEVCKRIQYLYQYFVGREDEMEETYLSQLSILYENTAANLALCGVSAGVLLKKKRLKLEEVMERFSSYVYGTEEKKRVSVSFLKGFFLIAKDVIFVEDKLLLLLDEILRNTKGELFLEILPELRLCFTSFLPFELDRIAKRVSELYGMSTSNLLSVKGIPQQELEECMTIDAFCKEQVEQWLPKRVE